MKNPVTAAAKSANQGLKAVKVQLHDGGEAFVSGVKHVSSGVAAQTSAVTKKAAKGTKQALHQMEDAAKATGQVILAPLGAFGGSLKSSKKKTPVASSVRRISFIDAFSQREILLPVVDPDETIQKMDIILRKRVTGLTVEQFYDLIWKEKDKDNPFYSKWLEASGKDGVQVQDWEQAEGGVTSESPFAFVSSWDEDHTKYGQRRGVDFTFTRTTHLYTGPPIAKVKQTHYCKMSRNENERCILHMQIEMEGIPFANCFNVQIRWVITRLGGTTTQSPVLEIKVGLYVNFVEQTILAGKIRSGTTEETTKSQQSLLQAVLNRCSESAAKDGQFVVVEKDIEDMDMHETYEEKKMDFDQCANFFPRIFADIFKKHRNDAVSQKARSVKSHIQDIIDKWEELEAIDPDIEAKVESELTDIQAALVTIEQYLQNEPLGSQME